MAGQATLPLTTFVTPDGNPVANGFLTVRLNVNASLDVSGTLVQVQNNSIKVPLDSSGTVVGSPLFWRTDMMSPQTEDLYYVVNVYSATGQLLGTYKMTVA